MENIIKENSNLSEEEINIELNEIEFDLENIMDMFEEPEIAGETTDLVRLYLNEIMCYPLLTVSDERKYGKDLKLYDQVEDIICLREINDHLEPMLYLEKVLASITTEEEKKYITDILYNYYFYYTRKESNSDLALKFYIDEYSKLCDKLDHIPNIIELSDYFSKENKYNLLKDFASVEKIEQKELLKKVSMYVKYMIAKNTMINCNLRLVVSIAKNYYLQLKPGSLDLLDLINEGNQGLIKAVERFDVDKGNKFSSYAFWWIRQGISRGFQDKDKLIRLPVHMYEKNHKIYKQIRMLEQSYGRKLTNREISQELNISLEELKEYFNITNEVLSLDLPLKEDHGKEFMLSDIVLWDKDTNVEKNVIKKEEADTLEELLSTLTSKEEQVLRLRFGLDDGRERTLSEIGKKFGVTRERIRQIEGTALEKLRHPSRIRKIKP